MPSKDSANLEMDEPDAAFASVEQARNKVAEIAGKYIGTAKEHPELLYSQHRGEESVSSDYAERVILELIQNAADANRERSDQIGAKGLGFRSVLNFTTAPRIDSGVLRVGWSIAIAKELSGRPNPPVLSFPSVADDEDEVLRSLRAEYDTVIALPFKDEDARLTLEKDWRASTVDPSLLVFVEGLSEVCWVNNGETVTWKRSRKVDVISVEVTSTAISYSYQWQIWQGKRAAVGWRIDEELPRTATHQPLRCYFPTKARNPFRNLLLHGGFQVSSNRNEIQAGEQTEQIRENLKNAILKAVVSLTEPKALFRFLETDLNSSSPVPLGDDTGTLIWKAIQNELLECPLPSLSGRKLDDLEACPKGYPDLPSSWGNSNDIRLRNWENFKAALSIFHPNGITDLPLVPLGIESSAHERTLLAYCPGAPLTKDVLQNLPWAPVEGHQKPIDSRNSCIFTSPKGSIPQVPDHLPIRFLVPEFVKAIRQLPEGDKFLKETLNVHQFSLKNVIEHGALPHLENAGNQDGLLDFLFACHKLESDEKSGHFDWIDNHRFELSRKLRVPCLASEPMFISEVYAGKEWTGDDYLERVFGNRSDRAFLHTPPEDPDEKNLQERFYRWLGVGWSPKPLKKLFPEDQSDLEDGGPHDLPNQEVWKQYAKTIEQDFINHNKTRTSFSGWEVKIEENWLLDGGSTVLQDAGALACIVRDWDSLSTMFKRKARISHLKHKTHHKQKNGAEKKREENTVQCLFHWLLKHHEWMPVEGKTFPPSMIFITGKVTEGLAGWVAEIDPSKIPQNAYLPKDKTVEILRELGLRDSWKDVRDADWLEWLKDATQRSPASTPSDREQIRSLYKSLMDHRLLETGGEVKPLDDVPKLWALIWHNGRFDWQRAEAKQIYFVDRPDLQCLPLEGVFLFPVELEKRHKKAKGHLKLETLSAVLKGTLVSEDGRSDAVQCRNKLSDRLAEIEAMLVIEQPDQAQNRIAGVLKNIEILKVDSLHVKYFLSKNSCGVVPRKFFLEASPSPCRLNLASDDDFQAFAEGLLLACGLDADKTDSLVNLLKCLEDELPEILRRQHVPPERVEELRKKRELLPGPTLRELPPTSETAEDPSQPGITERNPIPKGGKRRAPEADPPSPKPSPSNRPHPQAGHRVQLWLFDEIRSRVKPRGWSVTWEDKSDGGGRTDILLKGGGHTFHIEVKRINSLTIHLSKLQIECSKQNPKHYFVALVGEEGDGEKSLAWLWDPLTDLKDCEKKVRRTWKDETDETAIVNDTWEVPEPIGKDRAPDSFKIKVTLSQDRIKNCASSIDDLLTKLPSLGDAGAITAP